MARRKKPVKMPSWEDEQALVDVLENSEDKIKIRNKTFRFRWLSGHARNKITKILLSDCKDEFSIQCKVLAAANLNGYFKIKFFYWFLWRWYHYIRQYGEDELTEVINLIKKKVPVASYFANTTLLIATRQTIMQMNRREASLFLQEHSGGKNGKSAVASPTSPNPSESSESR